MCGRYANHVEKVRSLIDVLGEWPQDGEVAFNICPTQTIPVFTRAGGKAMRWGLVPGWSKEISGKYATFNARIESVATKPAFRNAWSKSQHCLIPALGYYEWRKEGERKQPYFVRAAEYVPLVFAGLYEPARENIPASCTIITLPAAGRLKRLHPRMPAVFGVEAGKAWLGASGDHANAFLNSVDSDALTVYAVDTAVNNPRNNGPDLIDQVAAFQ